MSIMDTLRELSLKNGISGFEDEVRDYICYQLVGLAEYRIDNLGNIIAFKKGRKTPEKKLMISAHMDEVGFVVTHINSDGTLKIGEVGGIDNRVVFGRRVLVGNKKQMGVIGSKAIHNCSASERSSVAPIERMNVDIGAKSYENALENVALGEPVSFISDFIEFGDGFVKGKAIDDRAGCAIMLDLIRSDLEYDTYFTFVVQEEVGLRGATTAAFSVNPDIAIVLEATTAADIPSSSGEKKVCQCKKGPVVSFMDKRTIYDNELYKLTFDTAKEEGIPCQTKTVVAGGNDSGAIHISGDGVRTISISLPCRYLHSPSCVIAKEDFENANKLTAALIKKVHSL